MLFARLLPGLLALGALHAADLGSRPCADSGLYAADRDFWADASWEEAGGDACDPEESLLFPGLPAPSATAARESNRASFSMARNAGGEARSTLRQQAQKDGWSQRVEVRDDTLTRRRLGLNAGGWRLVAGDLDDPELPLWPAELPRRTLPRGWRGSLWASPIPQGFAAGVVQPRWRAWAARAWNPVETGEEPPWNPVWNLHHVSTGISLSLPWVVTAQAMQTRITQGARDSVAEQQWAGSLASPDGDLTAVAALSDLKGDSRTQGKGWALATRWHHRFENAAALDFTARQRGAAWRSAWDPAVTEPVDPEEEEAWGAGEFRLGGSFPWERATFGAETWRAWNPAAGTARRGLRGRALWRGEGARLEAQGTHRAARAASGSVSLYRYLEVETRLEENPRFRVAAFRAWNGSGLTRTGIFVGLEPAWETLRAGAGMRGEADADDHVSAQGSASARWNFTRRWNLDASAAAPCYPRWDAEKFRWRVTVNYAAAGGS